MPYIKSEDREKFEEPLTFIGGYKLTEGELNYLITRLCHQYLKSHGEKYATYNSIIGVLECAKLELYRRKIGDYENTKIKDNGDV